MLKISIISVFPDLHKPFIGTSLIARAIEEQKIKCQSLAYSDFCKPKERIDVAIAGHGPGMVIKPEVVAAAIEHVEKIDGPSYRIFFSPQGVLLTQSLIKKLASQSFDQVDVCTTKQVDDRKGYLSKHILLICSRYEGMDIRVEEHYADLLLSIGDYVLMGGETAANVFLEGFLRLLPGVVGNADSVAEESFEQGLLDYSSYALPVVWKGYQMPEVIRSGNHKALQEWRDTSNSESVVVSDRNLESDMYEKPYSVYTAHDLGWEGFVAWNDGSVGLELTHLIDTRYGKTGSLNIADNLFDPAGDDDAYMIHTGD